MEEPTFRFPTGIMAWFILESNRKFCAIFRRQVQKICQETAGRLFIEDGVVVTSNEKSAKRKQFLIQGRKDPAVYPCCRQARDLPIPELHPLRDGCMMGSAFQTEIPID